MKYSKMSCQNLKHFRYSMCASSIPSCLFPQFDHSYCSALPYGQFYSKMESQLSLHDSVLMLPYSCLMKCYPLNLTFLYTDSFTLLPLMRKLGLEDSHKPSLMVVDTKAFSNVCVCVCVCVCVHAHEVVIIITILYL